MGIETGVDLEGLVDAGDFISKQLRRPSHSRVAVALVQKKKVRLPGHNLIYISITLLLLHLHRRLSISPRGSFLHAHIYKTACTYRYKTCAFYLIIFVCLESGECASLVSAIISCTCFPLMANKARL